MKNGEGFSRNALAGISFSQVLETKITSIVISRVGSGEGYPFLLFNGGRLGKLPAVAHNKPTEQPYARSAVHTMVREDLKVF